MKKYVEDKRAITGMYVNYTVQDFITRIEKMFAELPDAHAQINAKIEMVDIGFHNPEYKLFLIYPRLETDEEERKREEFESQLEKRKFEAEAREYERLKVKFEQEKK